MEATVRFWTDARVRHHASEAEIEELVATIRRLVQAEPTLVRIEVRLEPAREVQ